MCLCVVLVDDRFFYHSHSHSHVLSLSLFLSLSCGSVSAIIPGTVCVSGPCMEWLNYHGLTEEREGKSKRRRQAEMDREGESERRRNRDRGVEINGLAVCRPTVKYFSSHHPIILYVCAWLREKDRPDPFSLSLSFSPFFSISLSFSPSFSLSHLPFLLFSVLVSVSVLLIVF